MELNPEQTRLVFTALMARQRSDLGGGAFGCPDCRSQQTLASGYHADGCPLQALIAYVTRELSPASPSHASRKTSS